ncbi:MAG: hypothetical protein AB8B91_11960 [Rubripirellula sp.]
MMNSTTFTIESVHGIKQTFVLGTSPQTANGTTDQDPQAPPAPKAADQTKRPAR